MKKISVSKNIVYVRASQDCNNCQTIEGFVYYASHDNGQTWEEVTSPTNEVLQILKQKQNKQSPVCILVETKVCYRITYKEQVEISNDGGVTWQSDWQIPAGRKDYMQMLFVGPGPTIIPFDIQVTESAIGHFVVVAMGNQGVLVKSPDGNWNRYAVGLAVPTPYQAANFREATDVLSSELYSTILIAFCSFLLLSFWAWVTIYIKSDKMLRKKILTSCLVFLFSIVILPSYYIFLSSSPNIGWLESLHYYIISHFRYIIAGARIIINILPFISFWVTWLMVIRISLNKDLGLLTLLLSVVFSVILYFCILLPFQLWALGTISVYETALVISWLVGIIVVLIALISEFRIAVLAIRPISK
ncbi:MAG: hypothetical protein HOP27_03790 [Anaerolineales bacterium]|nr:hypothetical protein [Anaerolineales bacterium]